MLLFIILVIAIPHDRCSFICKETVTASKVASSPKENGEMGAVYTKVRISGKY